MIITSPAGLPRIEAIRAIGTIVLIRPTDFLAVIAKQENPLIIKARSGIIRKHYRYLTSYKGITFFTKSLHKLELPEHCELIRAKKIMVPAYI